MKRITLQLFILIISANLNAQNNREVKNSIKVNGLALINGFYEFQYERVISDKGTIKIGFGVGTPRNVSGNKADNDFEEAFSSNTFNNGNKHIVEGFTVNADYRYFFGHWPIPKGLYVSPGIQYLKLNDKYSYINSDNEQSILVDYDYSIFNIRALFGYQMIIGKSILINPYLGAGVALGEVDGNNSRAKAYGTGFSLNAGIDVGIGF